MIMHIEVVDMPLVRVRREPRIVVQAGTEPHIVEQAERKDPVVVPRTVEQAARRVEVVGQRKPEELHTSEVEGQHKAGAEERRKFEAEGRHKAGAGCRQAGQIGKCAETDIGVHHRERKDIRRACNGDDCTLTHIRSQIYRIRSRRNDRIHMECVGGVNRSPYCDVHTRGDCPSWIYPSWICRACPWYRAHRHGRRPRGDGVRDDYCILIRNDPGC